MHHVHQVNVTKGYLRAAHADLLDGYVQQWDRARTLGELIAAFEREGVAGAPVYDIAQP